jgi:hypothetical protein
MRPQPADSGELTGLSTQGYRINLKISLGTPPSPQL